MTFFVRLFCEYFNEHGLELLRSLSCMSFLCSCAHIRFPHFHVRSEALYIEFAFMIDIYELYMHIYFLMSVAGNGICRFGCPVPFQHILCTIHIYINHFGGLHWKYSYRIFH